MLFISPVRSEFLSDRSRLCGCQLSLSRVSNVLCTEQRSSEKWEVSPFSSLLCFGCLCTTIQPKTSYLPTLYMRSEVAMLCAVSVPPNCLNRHHQYIQHCLVTQVQLHLPTLFAPPSWNCFRKFMVNPGFLKASHHLAPSSQSSVVPSKCGLQRSDQPSINQWSQSNKIVQ